MVAKKKTDDTADLVSSAPSAPAALPEESLGARVKAKRTELRITHDGLSELTKSADVEGRGISRTTIRGYELGTYKPGAREIRILSLALNVSPSWLLLGSDDAHHLDGSRSLQANGNRPKVRWADLAVPLIAYSQLAPAVRKQVREMVETLYRLQVGEVRFRPMQAFIEDFVDLMQDAVRDASEQGNLNPASMRAVFIDTVEAMKKKHGEAEANLLMVLIEPWLETLVTLNPEKR